MVGGGEWHRQGVDIGMGGCFNGEQYPGPKVAYAREGGRVPLNLSSVHRGIAPCPI